MNEIKPFDPMISKKLSNDSAYIDYCSDCKNPIVNNSVGKCGACFEKGQNRFRHGRA